MDITALFNFSSISYSIIVTLLIIGATLRLTRLITSDTAGEWLIVAPLRAIAMKHERERREWLAAILSNLSGEAEHLQDPATRRLKDDIIDKLSDDLPLSWQARLISGLECPFCIGFWIGLALIWGTLVLSTVPVAGVIWLSILAALALNYLVGHLSALID